MGDRKDWHYWSGFNAGQVEEILGVLGRAEVSAEFGERLSKVASAYVSESFATSQYWPNRKEQRRSLNKVVRAVSTLEETLSNRTLLSLGDWKTSDWERLKTELSVLNLHCETSLGQIPPSGAQRKYARRSLVEKLAQIYHEITGMPPGLSHTAGLPSGPFYSFVKAVLEAIGSPEWQGVETDIKTVAKTWKNSGSKTG